MWANDQYRNQISILGLVASDASYKPGGFGDGDPLQTYPDSRDLKDEYPFYGAVLDRIWLVEDPSSPLAYESRLFPSRNGSLIPGVEFRNWEQVGPSVDIGSTGAAAIIYRRSYAEAVNSNPEQRFEYIVAFRGTDGLNGQDWFANIQTGKNQWLSLLADLFGSDGRIPQLVNPDSSIARIHFTGQSLGGALAQYTAYEYVRQRETSDSALFNAEFAERRHDLVTLTTFNSFAGGLGLTQIYDGTDESERFVPTRLAGVPTAHYSIENEIVHNVGGSFLGNELEHGFLNAADGGQSNLYHFASWKRWHDLEPGDQGYLGLVEGHRVESGFYQGLDRYNTTFSSAVQGGDPTGLVKIDRLQQVGEIFARFLGGDQSTEFASWARVTAALAMGAVFGGVGDVARLLQLVGNSLYKSDDINFLTKTIIASGIGSRLTASSLTLLAKPAIAIAGAASLVAAIADLFQKGGEAREATALMNLNIAADSQLAELVTVGINDGTKVGSADSVLRLSLLLDYLQPELLMATPMSEQKDAFAAIADDPTEFATRLYGSSEGYGDAFAFLTTEAKARVYTDDNQKTIAFGRDLAESGANEATRVAGADTAVRVALDEQIAEYISDLTAAVANLGGARLPGQRIDTPIVLAPVSSYKEYRAVIDELRDEFADFDSYSLFGLAEDAAADIEQKLSGARESLISAGQIVEIRVFASKPTNPFDDPAFEPQPASQASSEIAGGSAGTYVLFLPYEAGEGGQAVRLALTGMATDKLTVWSEGTTVPMTDGSFTLTIAEGRKQVAFALEAADDLAASGSVSISAALLDDEGVATHRTDVEANIALTHEEQTFEKLFDPANATDFLSADRISGYFSDAGGENDPTLARTSVAGTARGDLFFGDHASESIDGGEGNDFVIEGPGSGTGTYTEADAIDGGAGNDFVTGHLGAQVKGGDGDDFVNANFAIRLAASRLSPAPSASLPELPAEIYADLAGFIRMVPTGTGPIANADGSLDFTYVRDFGINNIGNPMTGVSAKMGVVSAGGGTEIQRTADGGATFQFTTFNGVANITYLGASAPLAYGVAFESSAALDNMDAVLIDGGAGNDQLSGAGGFDFIQGGAGNDRMAGFGGDDTLEGEDGNDQIIGGAGDDYLDGGVGEDRLWGEGGNDGLWGGAGNDVLFGDAASTPVALQDDDYLDGGDGNDQLFGNGGRDELFGGAGNDVADGGDGDDYIDGEAGNDTLVGGLGDDDLFGGEGNDNLAGGDGIDFLDGEADNDQLDGGAGNDILFGGGGNDNLVGGLDDDVLDGNGGSDQIAGGAGADTLRGGAGSDRLHGGEGDDTLSGGAGDNVLSGDAGDDTYALGLADGLSIIDDQFGVNRLVYGNGIFAQDVVAAYTDPSSGPQDLVLIYGAGSRVAIRGGGTSIASLQFADGSAIELSQFLSTNLAAAYQRRSNVLIGTPGNDVLVDTSGADIVAYGLEGSDTITAGGGNDAFHGGPGNDTLNGAAGNDVYHFARGDGLDRITDVDSTPGNADAIEYAGDIFSSQVLVSRSGNDLLLSVAGTTDRITATGYFLNDGVTPNSVEEIRFLSDGAVWDVETVKIKAIIGTAGNDVLTGYASGDVISGFGGNDVLQGAGGADTLDGGAGNDVLRGGTGDDTYVFSPDSGADRIDEELVSASSGGFDTILISADIAPSDVRLRRITSQNLELRLDDGSTLVVERQFNADGSLAEPIEQVRFACDGTTWDLSTIRNIIATPTAQDDFLWGTNGDDVLTGGGGDDWLEGGRGSDMYLFNVGDGHDSVLDNGAFETGGEIDRIQFGPGITPQGVNPVKQLLFGVYPSLMLGLDSGDSLAIVNYFGTSPTSVPYLVEEIRFHDGTVWTDETIAALFPIFGTPVSEILGGSLIADVIFAGDGNDVVTSRSGNDVVYGGFGNDRLEGGNGDDRLFGEAGNDILNGGLNWPFPGDNLLDGGPGDDVLDGRSHGMDLMLGGSGNDRYLFGLGSGVDSVEDRDATAGNVDSIVVDPGVSPGQISGSHTPTHRILALNPQDQVHIRWDPAAGLQIEQVKFGDGTTWDVAALLERTSTPVVTNRAPFVSNPIPDQAAWEDAFFSLAVPEAFSDPDAGDALAYSATLSDGSPLPAWLSFDAETRIFGGMPGNDDVGTMDILLRGIDTAGAAASDVFALQVVNVNDAPHVALELGDRAVDAATPFTFTIPFGTFVDVDAGDSLSLSSSSLGGEVLPEWLAFDAINGTFSGTAPTSDIGISGIVVRAADASGAFASSQFALTVRAVAGSTVSGGSADDVIAGGAGDETLSGGGGNDALFGDVGDDVLRGGRGNDVLQGDAGNDVLRAGPGQSVLDGGEGDDIIFDGAGDSFIAGGAGNDIIRTGAGNDVIAFNRGDGWDTIYGGGDAGNTLSLGGGLSYSDLSFSRSGADLLLGTGDAEGMVFKDWYAGNKSVLNLQVILDAIDEFDANSPDPLSNRGVQTFDFLGLVQAFDESQAASPGLTSWAITNALMQFHLAASDDEALGGDLAYWYAKNRSLAGMSVQTAQQVIGAAGFGSDAQSLRPFSGLQEGLVRLG